MSAPRRGRAHRSRVARIFAPAVGIAAIACAAAPALRAAEKADRSANPAGAGGPVVEIVLRNDNSRGLHFFEPAGVYVKPGQTVRWVSSAYQHTVTAYHRESGRELRIPEQARPFDERLGESVEDYRDRFEWTFTEPGTYDYFCRLHESHGEVGRIVVGSPGGPAGNAPGYGGAPLQPAAYAGLSSSLLLPRVQQMFAYLDPQAIVARGQLPFPAELIQAGTAWHPSNPVAIRIGAPEGAGAQANAADPFVGRWVLDPARSRFPGPPPLREDFIFERGPDGEVRFRVEEERRDGKTVAAWVGRYDGKDRAMTGAPGRDTLGMVRAGDSTIMGVYKSKGRVTYSFVRSLSEDGRTMTTRVLGSTPDSRALDVLLVHRRATAAP